MIRAPKFYFVDVGGVNRLAKPGEILPRSEFYGKAFENWVFFASYRDFDGDLWYWRLASGIEVDFVLGDKQVAIEAKSSARIIRDHLTGLRALADDHALIAGSLCVASPEHERPMMASRFSQWRSSFASYGLAISLDCTFYAGTAQARSA